MTIIIRNNKFTDSPIYMTQTQYDRLILEYKEYVRYMSNQPIKNLKLIFPTFEQWLDTIKDYG